MTLQEKFQAGTKVFQIPLEWFRKVTAWINNFCPGTGMRMTRPSFPKESAPVEMSIDEEWLDERIRGTAGAYTPGDGVTISQAKQVSAKVKAGGGVKVDSDGLQIDPDHLGEGTGASASATDMVSATASDDSVSGVTMPTKSTSTWQADTTQKPLEIFVLTRFDKSLAASGYSSRFLLGRKLTFAPNGRLLEVSGEVRVYRVMGS